MNSLPSPTPPANVLPLCGRWMARMMCLHHEGVTDPAAVAAQEMGIPEADLRAWTLQSLRDSLRGLSFRAESMKAVMTKGGLHS